MTRETIAAQLVRQKAVLDLLSKANEVTRAQAAALYRPGSADAVTGGRVSMVKGRTAARVVDRHALLVWVKAHADADAIIVTESVNPAFVAALCASGGEWVDPATGEVRAVPGIAVTTSEPYLTVTTTAEAKEWAARLLSGAGVAALTADWSDA